MNIRNLFSWALPQKRESNYPTLDEVCFGEKPNPNVVTADNALTYVAYWAAVRRISGDLAKLPIHVYIKTPSGLEKQPLHPVQTLLAQSPNPAQTAYTWKETQQSRTLTWGNGYSEITFRGDGRPAMLRPIDSSRVTPMMNADGTISYDVLQPDGRTHVIISSANMLHTHGLGDGIQGYSVVELFKQNLGLSKSAENAGASFFNNCMRSGAVVTHPGVLTDEAFRRLQKSLKDQGSGSSNAGGLMLLEEGLTMDQWTIPPNDAQFLETRIFQVQDVARMFSIPPHKLAELSRATFSNVEEQELQYVGDCLQPWLTNWEQELERKLFLPGERGKYRIKFNVEGLLRGNSQARAEFYSKLFNIGVVSINEVRAKENMQTIGEKGDEHYVPVNLQTAEQAAKEPEPMPTEPELDEEDDDEENTEA